MKKSIKQMIYVLLAVSLLLTMPPTGYAKDKAPDQKPTAVGDGGVAATESPEASQAAITILKQGGNAVDAAVAASAAQGVTRPFSAGVGGGGFMNIYLVKQKRSVILDHVTETSENIEPDSYVNPETGELYSSDVRHSSGMSVGIPGVVKAWEEALQKYGTMSLSEVLQPAIEVAEDGFVADKNFVREVSENADKFRLFNSTKKVYLDENGNVPEAGSVMKNPDLAKTYRLIAENGSDIFYKGKIADAMIDTIHHPPVVENPKHEVVPGKMSNDDLLDYEVLTRNSTHINYRGYDVYSAPPSAGGATVSETLNILGGYNLSAMIKQQALHYYLESSRYAFADRSAYLGDPRHKNIPLTGLLSKGYAAEKRQNIMDNHASVGKVAPGNPLPYEEDPNKQPDPPSETDPAFYFDFSGNDGDSWDSKAFHYLNPWPRSPIPDGAKFKLQQNTGKIILDKRRKANGSSYGRAALNMRALKDSEMLVRFRYDKLGNDQRLRLWLQADTFSSGSTMPVNGYGIELSAKTKKLILRGRKGSSSTNFGSINTNLSTDWFWLRLRVDHGEVSVRLWDGVKANEPEAWDIVHQLSNKERVGNNLGKGLISAINFDYNSGNTISFDEVTVKDLDRSSNKPEKNHSANTVSNSKNEQDLGELQLAGTSQDEKPTETINLSVGDRDGNIVSYTSTINSIGGSGIVVPGYGFLLNNGFSGTTYNPRHRYLSAMSPTTVTKDGKPVMTVGAPSSGRIITTISQILMNNLDLGMTLPEAIAEPRMSQRNLLSGKTQYEYIYLDKYGELLDGLRKMGHTFTADKAVQGISSAEGVEVLSNGRMLAAAEPTRRGGGSAMAIDIGDIEEPSVANLNALVDRFEEKGEIENHEVAHALKLHLTVVGHYEEKGLMEKGIKHMEGFKRLLDHQKENKSISNKAYNSLKTDANALIGSWQ